MKRGRPRRLVPAPSMLLDRPQHRRRRDHQPRCQRRQDQSRCRRRWQQRSLGDGGVVGRRGALTMASIPNGCDQGGGGPLDQGNSLPLAMPMIIRLLPFCLADRAMDMVGDVLMHIRVPATELEIDGVGGLWKHGVRNDEMECSQLER